MIEFVIEISLYLVFFLITYFCYRKSLAVKVWILPIAIVTYLVATYYYFEAFGRLNIMLRKEGIFLDFGHANISILFVMAISYLTVFGFIAKLVYRRRKQDI